MPVIMVFMPTVKVEIMTSGTCAFCPPAKEILKKVCKEFGPKVKLVETSIDTVAGQKRAINLGIRAVPTILIDNEPKFTGVPRERWLRATIKYFLAEAKKRG